MVFVDLEKAYQKIAREVIWHVLENKHVNKRCIDAVKDVDNGVLTSVRIMREETNISPTIVSLY